MSIRKRDDLPELHLYRVVCRAVGTDEPWKLVSGWKRTYQTLSAARGIRTRVQREHDHGYFHAADGRSFEFAVQRAPVTDWEIVDD